MQARNYAKVAALALLAAAPLRAQDPNAPIDSSHVSKTLFTRRDAIWTGVAIAGTAAISYFVIRINNWWQSPSVQDGQSRHDLVDALTHVNETPLTIGAVVTYGIGRIGRWNTVTDVGLHWAEAMVLTDATSEIIRGPIGRARPRISMDNQYKFVGFKGFTDFGYRAFPSLHSAAGFATAATLVQEMHARNARATWIVGPLLYVAALVPGTTRTYLNQ